MIGSSAPSGETSNFGPQCRKQHMGPTIYLKSTWQRAGSATYMPHSQQKHANKSNTHTIRSNLKTKYNDNKKQRDTVCWVLCYFIASNMHMSLRYFMRKYSTFVVCKVEKTPENFFWSSYYWSLRRSKSLNLMASLMTMSEFSRKLRNSSFCACAV